MNKYNEIEVKTAQNLLKEGKHAHWIVIDADSEGDEAFCHNWAALKCSRCGFERDVEDGYVPDYCEGCGAKMVEYPESGEGENHRYDQNSR